MKFSVHSMRSTQPIKLQSPPVERHSLENGIRLLICQRPEAPVAAVTIWVRAGYFDEQDDEVGVSHVIEHMYFQGSHNYRGPERMAREIKQLGGQLNAGTYYDSTHYYVVLPARNLSKALEIQADALLRPLFDPDVLGTEIEAILQEARRKRDNAPAFALEKAYEIAFRDHRIRRWRIGEASRLRSFSRETLLSFFQRFYRPERVVISVAGAVDPDEVRGRVEALFSSLAPGSPPANTGPPEKEQKEFRSGRIQGDLHRAHLILLYHTPARFQPDSYPLRMLAMLMGSGRSCRFFRAIRERKRLASTIGASVETFTDIGLFTVAAETGPGAIRRAEKAILSEIDRACGRFEEWEMDRVRAILESRFHSFQEDVLGLSLAFARCESLGSYRLLESDFAKLYAVGPEEISRAAEKYLTLENGSMLEYLPANGPLPPPFLPPVKGRKRLASCPPVERKENPSTRQVKFFREPGVDAGVSPVRSHAVGDGIRLLLQEIPSLPLVTVSVLIPGGKGEEEPAVNGITQLLLAGMLKGSRRWPGERLAIGFESIGSGLGREITDDYFGFTMQTVSRRLPEALEFFFDMLFFPELAPAEVVKERTIQMAAIRRMSDESMPLAFRLFRQVAFPDSNYSLPILGSSRSVGRLQPEQVKDWHLRILRPRGAVVAVAGRFHPEEIRRFLEQRLSGWPTGSRSGKNRAGRGTIHSPSDPAGSKTRSLRRRRSQTAQIVGFPVPPLGHEDRFPLLVLQGLTSGLGGRFFREIRSRRGLAYTVSSMNFQARGAGAFLVYMATSPENEKVALRVLMQEIGKLRKEGPAEEEVRRSIQFLQGSYLVGLQGSSARAAALSEAEVQGLGYREVEAYQEKIGAVTSEKVFDVIRKYLNRSVRRVGIVRGEAVPDPD